MINDLNPERGICWGKKAKKEKWTLQAKGKPLNKGVAKCILLEKRGLRSRSNLGDLSIMAKLSLDTNL